MQHDLTQGSITRRLLGMAAFIGMGLLFQTLYFLVDLYFVAGIGASAIAGVGLAGNAFFLCMAASQMIGVGSLSLIARAIGAKTVDKADGVYRQAMILSLGLTAITLVVGYAFANAGLNLLAADKETASMGVAYLFGFLPALALMFPTNALGSALRAAGVVKPTMLIQTATVLINAVLAPVLIAGWGTGHPLGVFGAGLASSIAAAIGFVGTLYVFGRSQTLIAHPLKLPRPDFAVWRKIIGIGLPSAAEFLLMFITTGVVYAVIRHFGPEAQAGYGVGSRVMQAVFLPAMAVSFAVAPVAGQNFGAGRGDRVRRTVRDAAVLSTGLMLVLTALCHIRPDLMIAAFAHDPKVIEIGSGFLKIISLNFVATGLIFTASGTFQALGDTRPALFGSVSRLITFAGPALWLSTQPWARLEHVWWLSAASVFVHMLIALFFLRRELAKKLTGLVPRVAVPAAS
jgi:putative MATE family efflux protein